MDFETFNEAGEFAQLNTIFRHAVWIHPRYHARGLSRVQHKVLYLARQSRWVWACQNSGWLSLSPQALAVFRHWALSPKQIASLKAGPSAHVAMILRCAAIFWDDPCVALQDVDDSFKAKSLPGAWGAITKRLPDFMVQPQHPWASPIWVECERSIKKPRDYQRKLQSIRGYRIIYIASSDSKKKKLLKIFRAIGCVRIQVFSENEWLKFAMKLKRKIKRQQRSPQEFL